eukprot:366506-Chlamydomonas_euryale.AAC.9
MGSRCSWLKAALACSRSMSRGNGLSVVKRNGSCLPDGDASPESLAGAPPLAGRPTSDNAAAAADDSSTLPVRSFGNRPGTATGAFARMTLASL